MVLSLSLFLSSVFWHLSDYAAIIIIMKVIIIRIHIIIIRNGYSIRREFDNWLTCTKQTNKQKCSSLQYQIIILRSRRCNHVGRLKLEMVCIPEMLGPEFRMFRYNTTSPWLIGRRTLWGRSLLTQRNEIRAEVFWVTNRNRDHQLLYASCLWVQAWIYEKCSYLQKIVNCNRHYTHIVLSLFYAFTA